jgi:YgiT-type zinc finger domain-containing protein
MGRRVQKGEETMNCHRCGGLLENIVTDLPFKLNQKSITIIRQVPVWQCPNCNEYLLEDVVMEKVDVLLHKVDVAVEVEILNYAA